MSRLPEVVPPDPARSTPRDRQAFMARYTRLYARDLALEDALDPPPLEPPLPQLPDAGDPMPEHLAAAWDQMTPLEHTLIHGGRIWREPPEEHWNRIAICIDIFRAHGLRYADAIAMCRFPDGLGAHMPKHAEILSTLWRIGAPGYRGPRNWRWAEHLEATMGFGMMCQAPAQEVALVARVEWQRAQQHANAFLEALRRKLWPMCRAQMPEETILSATDQLQFEWGVFVPDDLLLPLLSKIDTAAAPWRGRRRRRA